MINNPNILKGANYDIRSIISSEHKMRPHKK